MFKGAHFSILVLVYAMLVKVYICTFCAQKINTISTKKQSNKTENAFQCMTARSLRSLDSLRSGKKNY